MTVLVLALIITIALGAFGIFARFLTLSCDKVKLCEKTFLFVGITGAVGVVVSYLLFFFTFMGGGTNAAFLRETYYSFALVVTVFVFVGLFVSLGAAVTKSRFRPLVVPVTFTWSVVGVGIVFVGVEWLGYTDRLCALYFSFLGVSALAVLSLGAYIELRRRRVFLSDYNNIMLIKEKRRAKRDERKIKKEAVKRLREKKNRLKHPKK